MSLTPGTRIASYEIVAPLGAGAMGEVFRARDTNLGRDVAIKVLPEEFAQDEERLQRFVREARLLAQLNHPGIAGVFGLETEGDTRFIVMELVDGETLGARIARGPIPWRDALEIAVQVADALDIAHEAGIVHRDLKPDNVGLTADDTAKLLDFGIGKPMNEELQRAVGSSQQMTQAGAILGTPTYICPEQFKGKPVDRRADIWAFGCLLYEMLTGAPAFPGETVGEIAAGVLNNEPDRTTIPADAPPSIERLIRDTLQKDPRERLRDMGEGRRALERVLAGEGEERRPAAAAASAPQPRFRSWLGLTAAMLFGAAVALAFSLGGGDGSASQDDERTESSSAGTTAPARYERRFEIPLPERTELWGVDVSNDGSTICAELLDLDPVNGGSTRLHVRSADDPAWHAIDEAEDTRDFVLSPDGQRLAFVTRGRLQIIDLRTMAPPMEIMRTSSHRGGMDWSVEDEILIAEFNPQQIVAVSISGRSKRTLATVRPSEGEVFINSPVRLPSASAILYRLYFAGGSDAKEGPEGYHTVFARDDEPPLTLPLTRALSGPNRHIQGRLVNVSRGVLQEHTFDPDTRALGGRSRMIADGVESWDGAPSGVIVYQDGAPAQQECRLYWADHEGKQVGDELGLPKNYNTASPSPVDDRVAVTIWDSGLKRSEIWILTPGGLPQKLTDEIRAGGPVWSPDGKRIAYTNRGEGAVYWRLATGGKPHRIATKGVENVYCTQDWSPDGCWISYVEKSPENGTWARFVWVGNLLDKPPPATGETLRGFAEPEYFSGQFSPDGGWITYVVGADVYACRFVADLEERRQQLISTGLTAYDPDWSPWIDEEAGTSEILYSTIGGIAMRIRVERTGGAGLADYRFHPPERAFFKRQVIYNRSYCYSRDAKNILVTEEPPPLETPLTVITDWQPDED